MTMDQVDVLPSIFVELYETERVSAYRRPIHEAERLGEVSPTLALRAIAAHANESLDDMPRMAKSRGIAVATLASFVNDATAYVFRTVVGRFAEPEQSYRATLLELYRGMSLARRLHELARESGDTELATWCERWLDARSRLLRGAAAELDWFIARPALPSRVVRVLRPRAV